MSISKDHERGTYYVQCYYRDWTGERKKKTKRGFKTKKAAAAWEVDFLRQMEGTPDMTLNAFYELYKKDIAKKVRITTQRGKQQLIETKILPYLGEKKLIDITPLDILSWQNAIQSGTTSNGLAYKDSYLRTIGNQLSAMLNHAVRYYNLPSNPMSKVDRMGSKKTDEMRFWTKDEYKRFSRAIMDKDVSFMIFEVLYWLGVRSGEALALTPADFDLKRGRVSITKTYISPDMSVCRAYISVFPSERAEEILDAINKQNARIRYELGTRVRFQLRIIPELKFFIDDSMDYLEHIDELLKK